MNKCHFIGNLTADPVKSNSGDTSICRFTIAVNRRYSSDEQKVDFFRITTFRKTADNCAAYLAKGRKVAVTGSLQINEYTDKDGNRRQGVEIVSDEVEFLTPKGEPAKANEALIPVHDDNLPF